MNDNDVIRLDQRVIVTQCGDSFCAEMEELDVEPDGTVMEYKTMNPRTGGAGKSVAEAFHNLKIQLPE